MNSEQRKQAAKRIQKEQVVDKAISPYTMNASPRYRRCAELLTLLADAERENDLLRGYATHKFNCQRETHPQLHKCTCKLDKILNKQGTGDE